MGLFERIKRLLGFGRSSATRQVATLPDPDDSNTVEEVVETSGGPLKPHHRRLAYRDPRLLPKKELQSASAWPPRKKKRLYSDSEARRLFSETHRTRNRSIRDLASHVDHLNRHGLPLWESEQDIAESLGLTVGQLQHFSIHRQRETTPHYVTFAIPKRGGGYRLIHAPKKRLRAIQRQLNEYLVGRLPVSRHAHGFRRGRSVASNAQPHVGRAFVIRMDLKDCFPSINYRRVRGLLISLGYAYPVATTLAVLMTEAPRQPVVASGKTFHVPLGPRVCVQGAPTSPGLCNAILMRMDRRLSGLAQRYDCNYTRYADDLSFSGDDTNAIKVLMSLTTRIAGEEGFEINHRKTRVQRQGRHQQVTGVTVNQQAGLSRRQRRRIRAAIHQMDPTDGSACRRLKGTLAWLQMLNPGQARPLQQAFDQRVDGGTVV